MTVARLGLDIDSAPLKRGVSQIEAIVPAARRAEQAAGSMAANLNKEFTRAEQGSKSLAQQIDRMFASSGDARERAADIAAYGKELDELRSRFNPLFAASQKYERELEDIARAEKLGAISAIEAANARQRAAASLVDIGNATEKAARGGNAFAFQIQNASYQIQDFAVQVASGTAASTALAQQLPQVAGGFGVWGAAAGAALAIGIPLIAMFVNSGDQAKTLSDQLEDLADSHEDLRDAQDEARRSLKDLSEDYGNFADEALIVLERLAEVQRQKSLADLESAAERISEKFGTLSDTISRVDLDRGITPFLRIAERAGDALDLSTDQAREFAKILVDLGSAQGAQAVATELERAQQLLRDSVGAGKELTGEAYSLYAQLNEAKLEAIGIAAELNNSAVEARDLADNTDDAGDSADELSDTAWGLAGAFSSAAIEANRLASQIQGAASAAAGLLNSQELNLRLSEIRLDTATIKDPVERAVREAAAEFDAKVGDFSGLDPVLRGVLDESIRDQKAEFVAGAERIARNNKELQDILNENLNKPPSGGRGGGRSGGRNSSAESQAVREAERQAEAYANVIENLEYQIDLVGKSEVAQRAANEARRANVAVTSEQGQAIADLVGKLHELQEEERRVQEVNDYVSRSLSDMFLGAIEGADSFKESLGGVLSQLASMAVSQGFQTLTAGVGGTGFGGILSSVFGIGVKNANGNAFDGGNVIPFSSGGIVNRPTLFPMSRGTGLMGEAGPEAIIPLSRDANGKLGIKSQVGGESVYVDVNYSIDARGADQSAIALLNQKMDRIVAENRKSFRSDVLRTVSDRRNRAAV